MIYFQVVKGLGVWARVLYRLFFALLVSVFASNSLAAPQESLIFLQDGEVQLIGTKVSIFTDSTKALSAREVMTMDGWFRSKEPVPNLGLRDENHWIYFQLLPQDSEKELLFEIAYPILDTVEFFIRVDGEWVRREVSGDLIPFAERKISHQNHQFAIELPETQRMEVLVRLWSQDQVIVPLHIGSAIRIKEANADRDIYSGIYLGVMVVMIFYNLFLFMTSRDSTFLYYSLYVGFLTLVQLSFLGFGPRFIWPNTPWFSEHLGMINSFTCFGLLIFFEKMFDLRKRLKLGSLLMLTILSLYVVIFFSSLFGFQRLAFRLSDVGALIFGVMGVIVAVIMLRRGNKAAIFFLVAWVVFDLGLVLFVLRNIGVLPYNDFTSLTMPLGTALEVTFFSMALGFRINTLQKEKQLLTERELSARSENERLIKNQNTLLETKVKERTEELESLYENLKEARSKMATLGELTAGIAHDLNNPLSYIAMSLPALEETLRVASEKSIRKEVPEEELLEAIQAIKGVAKSALRMEEIVTRLRSFSRPDTTKSRLEVKEWVEENLLLLQYELKQVHVRVNFEEAQQLYGVKGQLNRLLLNLLKNAIEATKNSVHPTIEVSSFEAEDRWQLRIADNGEGIPEALHSRIFNPFFTTKTQGTGLGLSESQEIMRNHGGTITVENSSMGGAHFILEFPKIHV